MRALVESTAPEIDLSGDVVVGGTLSAGAFIGDGSRITGIPFSAVKIPSGAIPGAAIAAGSITAQQLAPDLVLPTAAPSEDAWLLGGNRFDDDRPRVMGTRGAAPLHIYASGQPVLRLSTRGGTANVLAGYVGNRIVDDAVGSVVAGGGERDGPNVAGHNFATVGGGSRNEAANEFTTVGGGLGNVARGFDATIAGGQDNLATGSGSAISGGFTNLASGSFSAIAGGAANQAMGNVATVGGGFGNAVRGAHAVVPGGSLNEADGDYSFAAGRRAKAAHAGSFVWADGTDADVATTGANQWVVRASGGAYLYSDASLQAGVKLDPGSGSWAMLSDEAAKELDEVVDPAGVLNALRELPIHEWRYRTDASGARHMGPTAQDFRRAFALGTDDAYINYADAHGVALAAIQGLHRLLDEKTEQMASLERNNTELSKQLDDLNAQMQEFRRRLPDL